MDRAGRRRGAPIPSRRHRIGLGGWAIGIVRYLVLIVLAASFLLPFYWMVTSALKSDAEIYRVPPIWIPPHPRWANFPNAWATSHFSLYLVNTVVRYAVPATLATVLSSAVVAYGFSRIQWPGRDALFSICLATMMVPAAVTLVPLFITFRRLGWVNTYLPLVVPHLSGGPYYIFMLRQFFLSIPEELSDAARIDGAGEFRILLRIILPLAKSALTVVALFQFMGAWNDYMGPLIYINDGSKFPVALGIQNLNQAIGTQGYFKNAYPYLMAVSALVAAPIVIAFFISQRTFIEGISLTGLKG